MNEYENLHTHGHYYRYLYQLQESGRTNMMGAASYLQQRFGLDRQESRDILLHWMDQYEVIAQQLGVDI